MKLLFSLLLATLALVSAHVTITPNQIASGATTIINLQLSHGCNSTSLTNKVVVRFPSNITNIKPIDKVGWKLTRTSELLGYNTAAGSEAFYYNFTWEVDPSIYQGLPDWAFDVLSVRVTMPAATSVAIGSRFYIPVWQYCTGGLLDAWIITSSSSSDSHSSSDLPAPSFTVLDPTDVQFIPSQANVKSLEARVANLTSTVQALTGSVPTSKTNTTSAPTSAPTAPIINNGANTINYYEDSSSWNKADTISVIAIILAGISILVSVILTMKIASIEKQNAILSK